MCVHICLCVCTYIFVCVCFTELYTKVTIALSFLCEDLQINNITNASLETRHMLLKMCMTCLRPDPFPFCSQNLGSLQLCQPLSSTNALAERCFLGMLLLSISVSFPPPRCGEEVFALSLLGNRRWQVNPSIFLCTEVMMLCNHHSPQRAACSCSGATSGFMDQIQSCSRLSKSLIMIFGLLRLPWKRLFLPLCLWGTCLLLLHCDDSRPNRGSSGWSLSFWPHLERYLEKTGLWGQSQGERAAELSLTSPWSWKGEGREECSCVWGWA